MFLIKTMEKEIGKLQKNETTDIVIRIDDFGGRTGLTIREFVTSDRYTGFTKAGVRISAENFPKFKEMVNSVKAEDLVSPESEEKSEEPQKETKKSKKEQKELPDY